MMDDKQLLHAYARERSESAFGELVTRHIDFVYSTALRVVNGDSHLAQDVTQTVFIELAREAGSLPGDVGLAGWLHHHTCYTAAKAVRTERRRQSREQTAMEMRALDDNTRPEWELVAPFLDESLNQLNPADRDALVLRFLKQQDLRAVGAALGISDDAAQKRVDRALEKLHIVLKRRGATLSAAALGTALATEAVTAAPAGLAGSVAATALASAAAGSGTLTLFKFMATTKLKAAAISTVILAGAITSVVVQQQSQAKVRPLDAALRQQAVEFDRNKAENARLADLAALAARPPTINEKELDRLRHEVATLRQQTNSVVKLQHEVGRLRASLNEIRRLPESVNTQPTALDSDRAKTSTRYAMRLALAAMEYASDHGDQFPTNLAQAGGYLSNSSADPELKGAPNLTMDQFEIIYTGSQSALGKYAHPGSLILVRQRQPWTNTDGKWAKAYAFTDGSGTVVSVPGGDFGAWEQQHTVLSQTPNP